MMPGLDGLDVLRRLRQQSAVPVLMLTAKGDEADRVVGLELGADDYLSKPVYPRELLARIRAVLRHMAPRSTDRRLVVGDLEVDPTSRATRSGRPQVAATRSSTSARSTSTSRTSARSSATTRASPAASRRFAARATCSSRIRGQALAPRPPAVGDL